MMSDQQIAIVAVIVVLSGIFAFIFLGVYLTKYQYFEMDFSKGILLKRIKFSRVDLDWQVGKVYGFPDEFGEIKVMNRREIFIRSGFNEPGQEILTWNYRIRELQIFGRIIMTANEPWLEIRMGYASLIGGIYIGSFMNFAFSGVISEIIPSSPFVFFLILGTYFWFLKYQIINRTINICKKFCVGLR
ncbi:hypothetical protein V6Z05_06780 [Leptospira venezuelensis]|uniref:hypothetical protein n=1 Tax=Leptospira venezuelensis TaxID=1958811 RepID=UPI0012FFD250|nr:hypothetical protein [Leptospira venezuelensis]